MNIRMPFDGNYPITQNFGENPAAYARFGMRGHNGIDFGLPTGTPVLAVDYGVVAEHGYDDSGYGYTVKLDHSWGESRYGHMEGDELFSILRVGDTVEAGQPLGLSDNTGNSTGPHLHFGVRIRYPDGHIDYSNDNGYLGYVDPAGILGLEG